MPKQTLLRTPEDRFEDLPDYDFTPNYLEIDGIRIHYVDEGPPSLPPILLMHGEPSWSYLYRKMIPLFVNADLRVIAPDLMGFGRSDKPSQMKDYTYQSHVDIMSHFVEKLDLSRITLFGQDWGGMIGLRVVGELSQRFDRIVVGNTGFPSARGIKARIGPFLFNLQVKRLGTLTQEDLMRETNFLRWVAFSRTVPELPIGGILQLATVTELPPQVIRAYEAPFPDESYKVGARIFPSLVVSQLTKNQRVWDDVLTKWNKPFLTTFSDRDPITAGGERYFQRMIPGAQELEHVTIKDAGHFLQEDKGEELAQVILNFIEQNPV